jgi:hypothetical protein
LDVLGLAQSKQFRCYKPPAQPGPWSGSATDLSAGKVGTLSNCLAATATLSNAMKATVSLWPTV